MLSYDVSRGSIDQIPVVDLCGVREVRAVNPSAAQIIPTVIPLDHKQQRHQPLLMPQRRKQLEHGRIIQAAVFAHDAAHLGHRQAKELVALTVLSRSGLEETLRVCAADGIAQLPQLGPDRRESWFAITGGFHRDAAAPATIARATACCSGPTSGKYPLGSVPRFCRFVSSTIESLYCGTPAT